MSSKSVQTAARREVTADVPTCPKSTSTSVRQNTDTLGSEERDEAVRPRQLDQGTCAAPDGAWVLVNSWTV